MGNIIFGFYVFLDLLVLLVWIDVILSWLPIFQINFRPKFIADIIDPIYKFIKNNIPTTIGPIDVTPIIVIFGLYFLKGLLLLLFPEISRMIQLYSSI